MKTINKLIVSLIMTATIACSVFFSMTGMKGSKQEQFEKQYYIIASSIYEAVQSEITKPIYTALAMSNDELLVDLLEREDEYTQGEAVDIIAKYLNSIKDATGAQTAFLISDHSKRYYSCDGLNKILDVENDEHDVWYSIFLNTRKPYDLDVDTDQVNGDSWTVFVNARIVDSKGQVLGVCGLGLSMENLQTLLVQYEEEYDIKVNFIDSDGLVQVDTDAINIENAYLYDVQYGKEKDGYSYVNSNGEFVVMRYVDNLQWYLVVHGNQATIKIKEMLPVLLGAAAVIVINIAAVFYFGRKKKK